MIIRGKPLSFDLIFRILCWTAPSIIVEVNSGSYRQLIDTSTTCRFQPGLPHPFGSMALLITQLLFPGWHVVDPVPQMP